MNTHAFIKFPPDLGELEPIVWLQLGELQAKIEHIKSLPIPPADSGKLRHVYLAKGVHGTTAIEGNSFSEDEVAKIISKELEAPPSREYQQQQIDNMVNAFNTVYDDMVRGESVRFSVELIHTFHKLVLKDLQESLSKEVTIGEFRRHRVEVGRYLAAPPEDCARLMGEYCEWLNEEPAGWRGHETAEQIVKAIAAHVYFAWIHPYGDGNGRMARLIEFDILLRAGVPDVAAHLLSNFYYLTVNRYWRELQDSHGEYVDGTYPDKGNLLPFIEYAIEGFRDSLNEQCLLIYNYQLGVIWHDLIHTSFPKRLTDVQQRQKRLALDLTVPRFQEGVAFEDVRYVTPAVAESYAGKGDRTLYRDLEKLMNMNLIRKVEDEYRPNTELLFTFFANTRAKSD